MKPQRYEERKEHGVPMVFMQVRDIGMGIPGIQVFCNRHADCTAELQRAIRSGARLVPGTYWYGKL